MKFTKIELFLINWVCKIILNGGHFREQSRLTEFFKIFRKHLEAKFYEDNRPTLNAFEQEALEAAQK